MRHAINIAWFFAFPVIVLFTYFIASEELDLHKTFPNFDIPFHFMGGVAIAYTSSRILFYLEKENSINALNKYLFLVFIICITATSATSWELLEFGADQLIGLKMQVSLANTMQDQFMGMLGGIAAAIYFGITLNR